MLCQLDRKFILCRAGDSLLCIDQHAAHERVRVEQLEYDVLHGERRAARLARHELEPAVELKDVAPRLLHTMVAKRKQLEQWGFRVEVGLVLAGWLISLVCSLGTLAPPLCCCSLSRRRVEMTHNRRSFWGMQAQRR